MNLHITGLHLEVTPALVRYVQQKMQRLVRHHQDLITVNLTLSVDPQGHQARATVHSADGDAVGHALDTDMYAAIDLLVDKLDRQVLRHKEKWVASRMSREPAGNPLWVS